MRVDIYKFTFRINASHHALRLGNIHSHTFEITVYLRKDAEPSVSYDKYDKIESLVLGYLQKYTNMILDDVPPFDRLPSTIENMGDEFYLEIAKIVETAGYRLTKLEISENPQRVYSVSEAEPDDVKKKRLEDAVKRFEAGNTGASVKNAVPAGPKEAPEKPSPVPVTVCPPLSERKFPVIVDRPASPVWFVLSVIGVILAGFLMMVYVREINMYPLGLDIHGHLFKSDFLYHSILEGNYYPLLTHYWYNGTQIFRYWPALPYYVLAFFQFLAGGDAFSSYLLFIWFSFSAGGIGWLMLGRKSGRPALGLFFAMIWFMLPDNLRVFFGEGNFLRMFVTVLIPFILYCLWQFVEYRRKKMIFPLILMMIVSVFSHLMISAMIGVAAAIYLLIYVIANRRWIESIQALFAMLFAFAVAGIWVYPSLVGGIASMGSDGTSALMASLSEPLSVSLQPFRRLNGGITDLYFGVSLVIVAILGLLLSNRKSLPGFAAFLIIILGTTTAFTPFFQLLPLNEFFRVQWFIPIVYAMFFIAFLEWRKLKKPILVILCAMITLDSLVSFNLPEFNKQSGQNDTVSMIDGEMNNNLYTQAKEITKQRVSLMDLSRMGAFPSYALCSTGRKIDFVYGWTQQGAPIAQNIAYLNEALERKNYLYVFDRNLELGADSILFDKQQIQNAKDRSRIESAAARIGYTIVGETDTALLFSYPVDSNFGVVSKYDGLAIGTTAELVPGILASFHPGDKLMIDDYSVDELKEYHMLYLSGFFYHDKATAEQIVRDVARSGVKIYIDMNRIPTDPLTNRMTFLDVSAQPITFIDKFPELVTDSFTAKPLDFPEGYESWNTVYLTGLNKSEGYAWFKNTKLDFVGTGDTENISFIGFNLLFHAYTAGDNSVKTLFDSIMSLDEDALPDRHIVPIQVTYEANQIIIESPEDNVNTTIAYQDIFQSDRNIREMNNLLMVDKGTTIIHMEYPYLSFGIAMSVFGVLAEACICFLIFRKPKEGKTEMSNTSEKTS